MEANQQLPRTTEKYRTTTHFKQRVKERDIRSSMVQNAIEEGDIVEADSEGAVWFKTDWLSLTVKVLVTIEAGKDGLRELITVFTEENQ